MTAGQTDLDEQLVLEDELVLLVLLLGFICLVVLPAHHGRALPAGDVAHYVAAGSHAALDGLVLNDIDDAGEEIGLSVLSAEVLFE